MAKNRKNDIELIPVEKRKRVIRVEDRKRRGRKRRVNRIEMAGYAFCLTLLLFVISVGVAFNLLQSHKSKMQDMANNAVPELCKAEDGTYELNWRSLEESGADSYYVNVSTYAIGSEKNQRTFFSGYVD